MPAFRKTPPTPPAQYRRTSAQITAEYPIARRTLYEWAQLGKVTVWKFGARNIYDARQIEALIQVRRSA
ncbi:MAG: hypothetical protein WCF04_06800 [Candidatus Nanopelagicales bacterium]